MARGRNPNAGAAGGEGNGFDRNQRAVATREPYLRRLQVGLARKRACRHSAKPHRCRDPAGDRAIVRRASAPNRWPFGKQAATTQRRTQPMAGGYLVRSYPGSLPAANTVLVRIHREDGSVMARWARRQRKLRGKRRCWPEGSRQRQKPPLRRRNVL